jgi:glutamyl-tRNA synthetase
MDELKTLFSLEKIGKANAVFNPEKLNWVSGMILKDRPAELLYAYLKKYFSSEISFCEGVDDAKVVRGIAITQAKVKNVLELIEQLGSLFGSDPSYDLSALKPEEMPQMADYLGSLLPILTGSDFTMADLEAKVRAEADRRGDKLAPLAKAIRYSVTGGKVSPGLFEMLEVQGKDRALRRMKKALEALS